jgi:hypothetical protein
LDEATLEVQGIIEGEAVSLLMDYRSVKLLIYAADYPPRSKAIN